MNARTIIVNLNQLESSNYFLDSKNADRWCERMERLASHAGVPISLKWTGVVGAVDTFTICDLDYDEDQTETPEWDWLQLASDAAGAPGRLRYVKFS